MKSPKQPTRPTSPSVRTGRGWETLLALLAALAAGGAGGYLIASRSTSTSMPVELPIDRPEKVTALGRLQPANGVVPVYGPPGDRITNLAAIAPGDFLKAGTKIAELASRTDRLKEVQIAKTQQQEAETAQKLARITGDKKVLAATAELNQARANKSSDLAALDAKRKYVELQAETAGKQVDRLKSLRAKGVQVADEDLDKAELLKAQADAEVTAAKESIKKTETTYVEMEKAADARVAAAKAELAESLARVPIESSKEKLELAEKLCDNTIIRAPVSGTVLKVIGRDGQPTGVEPILQMADLSSMTAVAEVYENDVARLAKWLKDGPVRAQVTNPALPHPLVGVVGSEKDVSRMIARNQVYAMGPREDVDRRVVEVRIHLNNAGAPEAGRFVGLQVTVTLEPGK